MSDVNKPRKGDCFLEQMFGMSDEEGSYIYFKNTF